MRDYAPFALADYARERMPRARFSLAAADCEPLTLAELLELATDDERRAIETLALGYSSSRGDPRLRTVIAAQYDRLGPEHVLIATPIEALLVASRALLEPGDHVVCTAPVYQPLAASARALGCEVTPWVAHDGDGSSWSSAGLQHALRSTTRLVVLNFPHNPTGLSPPPDEFAAIVDVVRDAEIPLLCDEIFRGLELSADARLPSAVDVYERAVVVSGVSKTLGLAGLRLGWLVSREQAVLDRALALKDYISGTPAPLAEHLATIALRKRQSILSRQLELLRRNLRLLEDFSGQHSTHFEWVRPVAGPLCFPRLRRLSAQAFCDWALESRGVMILPSTLFESGDRNIRIGFGRRDVEEALAALAGGLEQLE